MKAKTTTATKARKKKLTRKTVQKTEVNFF